MIGLADLMPPLYVAALYGASRLAALRGNARQMTVIDAVAFNWLLCTIEQSLVPYPDVVPTYMCTDVMTALWLSLRVKGKCSGIAEMFYIALIMFNAAFFFRHAFSPWTHWVGLSMLSWGQLLAIIWGVMRHDLAKVAERFAALLGVQRHMAFRRGKAER